MESFYELKKILCRELEDVAKKGELSAGDLDVVDKLTHSIKSLVTIMAMEEGGYSNDGGYSGARRRDSMGRYADSGSYGGSYGRYYDDRSMDGGYSGRRYSREEGKSSMIKQFESLMQEANSQEEREIMHQALNKLKNL